MWQKSVLPEYLVWNRIEHIREKIVGTVFHYNPDTKKVMSNLIQKNFTYNTNDRRQLEKNINYLAESMEKRNMLISVPSNFFYKKWISCFRYWTVRITK